MLDLLAGTAARSLREAAEAIDVPAYDRAAEVIARANRVHLYGAWGDAVALHELQMRLMRIGVAVWFHESGGNTLRAVVATLTDQDVVLVLGRSGRDEAGIGYLRSARAAGAHTIALHGDTASPLAKAAETSLFTGIRNGSVWTQYYAGRASDILTTSFLWLLVAQKRAADPTLRYVDDGIFVDIDTSERHPAS